MTQKSAVQDLKFSQCCGHLQDVTLCCWMNGSRHFVGTTFLWITRPTTPTSHPWTPESLLLPLEQIKRR